MARTSGWARRSSSLETLPLANASSATRLERGGHWGGDGSSREKSGTRSRKGEATRASEDPDAHTSPQAQGRVEEAGHAEAARPPQALRGPVEERQDREGIKVQVSPAQLANLGWMLGGLALDYGIDQIEEWVKDFHGDPRLQGGGQVPPHTHSQVTGDPAACDFGDDIETHNMRELAAITREFDCDEDD